MQRQEKKTVRIKTNDNDYILIMVLVLVEEGKGKENELMKQKSSTQIYTRVSTMLVRYLSFSFCSGIFMYETCIMFRNFPNLSPGASF